MLCRLVDRYSERGHAPILVQLRIFALSAALMPLGALITMASSAFVAVAIITVVVAVCQAWFVGYNVLLAGLFPVKINASAVGILGAVGAKIGRASCRERVWQYGKIPGVAVSLKKKKVTQ